MLTAEHAPFFVVGCPRSGTTLLQVLLDAHPRIAIPTEGHLFSRFGRIFGRYGDLRQERNLRLFVSDVLHDQRIGLWKLDVSVPEFLRGLTTPSIRGVFERVYELYARREGKARWGDKSPVHALHIRDIKQVFPEAKFIHLVRDGRDVAESTRRMPVGPKSMIGIARRWRRYVLAFREAKAWLPSGDALEVQYEQLVRDPAQEMARILAFLGESPMPLGHEVPETRMRRYLVQESFAKTLHQSLAGKISEGKIGVFLGALSPRDLELFEAVAGDVLTLYGYGLVTSGTARIRPHERVTGWLQDHVLRYQRKFFGRSATIRRQGWVELGRDLQWRTRTFIRSLRHTT